MKHLATSKNLLFNPVHKEETKASTTIDCFPQLSYANETDRALYFMQCNPLRDLHAKICHEEVPVCTLLNENTDFFLCSVLKTAIESM